MMNIGEMKEIFESIADAKGSNAKMAIIKENKFNEDFVFLLEFLFNPYKTTGIAEKKLSKDIKLNEITTQDFKDIIEIVLKNNTGKDDIIAIVKTFIYCQKEEYQEFLNKIITKTYKCGVSSTSINKIIPDLIPTFGVMLATKIEDVKNLYAELVIATVKIDGFRCTAIKDKDNVDFYNRSGIKIEGLVELEKEFKEKMPDGVYDGELVAAGIFKEAKDQYKATSKLAKKKGEKIGLKLITFDYIENINDFLIRGRCETICIKRKKDLTQILASRDLHFIEDAKVLYYDYYNEEKIMNLAAEVTNKGEEGLMLNIAGAPYECKRTKTLIKIKKFHTCDLRVVGYTEGKGENVGMLGALVVEYKGNVVNVGSGLTLKHRKEFWECKDDMIGKIIEVSYREETQNENGELSLRHPSFKCVRDDKDEPSYN